MPHRLKHAQLVDSADLRARLSAAAMECASNETLLRSRALALLQEALRAGREAVFAKLAGGEDGLAVARLLADVTDAVVTALFDFTITHVVRARNPTSGERLALIAIGGYGRGELAPFSDIDLLFLRPYKLTPFAEGVTEFMLYMLWDLGLKVGHASRNVAECVQLAKRDHTIETALLESRLVAGDAKLAAELDKRYWQEVVPSGRRRFINTKLSERDERHARAGASRYMVEPNIKEGKGGLRDLHTLFWLARHQYGFSKPHDYIAAGVFSAEEWASFRAALRFLWTVRCHLHLIAGRAEERLTFDVQPELAKRMGYRAGKNQSAVERFMKRYFLVAKQVGSLTRVLCAKLEADHAKRAPLGLQRFLPAAKPAPIVETPGFRIESGRLNVERPEVLDEPVNLIRLFAVADVRDMDIHPAALRETSRRLKEIKAAGPGDEAVQAAFLEVVSSKRNPAGALRLMNEAGVLGRLLPEFGRVVGQTQFNMYHHYTVDEHTLNAVAYIAAIERGERSKEHPLSTAIFPKIINRRALYLAMLLHDIGKGLGDQQVHGERAARSACARLGLPSDEIELVGWLVRHHLLMNEVAQKRDIGDPVTVAQFARSVGTLERLRLLLVLTVADIHAVGPGVWNDWKGQLLRDLYRLTEAVLHGGRSDEQGVREQLAAMAAAERDALGAEFPKDEALHRWLRTLDDGYWLSHDRESQRWHATEVLRVRDGEAVPHVAARSRPEQGVTDVLVYAQDRPGLFASLAAAIATAGADVVDARVHTTSGGIAFDAFSIQSSHAKPFGHDHPRALENLITRLKRAALEDHPPPQAKKLSRRTAAFAIEPWVRIDNDLTPAATVVEISGRDRPGLLADLAHVFAAASISIVSAHIGAAGERAADVFYVQTQCGTQILDTDLKAQLQAELESTLRKAEPEAPADSAKSPLAVAQASTAL